MSRQLISQGGGVGSGIAQQPLSQVSPSLHSELSKQGVHSCAPTKIEKTASNNRETITAPAFFIL
jgi:hypothetical protein